MSAAARAGDPIRSMTGFGAATGERKGLVVRVEVRSVNHRHLLVKARLPSDLVSIESDVETRVRRTLERGSVTVFVGTAREASSGTPKVNTDVASSYVRELRLLQKRLDLSGELSISDVAGLPGVVQSPEHEVPDDADGKLVLKVVSQALDELVQMREAEGARLAADVRKNATAIAKTTARIEKRMPTVAKEHLAALKKRLADLLDKQSSVSDADLAREMALLSDRLDVSEELTRLHSHLEQLEELLAKGGAVGRRFDFLAQEFLREANTIGSKASDAKAAHAVVDLKTHIERLREQVQNVE